MEEWKDYFKANAKSWDDRVDTHLESAFYDMAAFEQGGNSLRHIELEGLGDVKGKSMLHLQCHFGQDTLSWARLGAKVTGVDFSKKAIDKAKELTTQLQLEGEFIEASVYDLPDIHEGQYDIVFTSYGTIGWLPDLDKWAKVVSRFLKPGGTFYIADFHPFIWTLDEETYGKFHYDYFNTEVIKMTEETTYADRGKSLKIETASWNHPFSETFQALINEGINIKEFKEFPYAPWNCFPDMKEIGHQKFVFKHLGEKIPYSYSIKGIKKS